MSLLDDLPTTKAAMALEIYNYLEDQFPLDAGLSGPDADAIRLNWEKLADAVSQLLQPTMQHIIDHGGTGGGGPQRIQIAGLVIAPNSVVYSCGASAPPASASCTWRSLLCKTGLGTAWAQLWDLTSDSSVATVSSTSEAPELKDSTVAIVTGHLYEVRAWTTGTAGDDAAILGSSQLIVG